MRLPEYIQPPCQTRALRGCCPCPNSKPAFHFLVKNAPGCHYLHVWHHWTSHLRRFPSPSIAHSRHRQDQPKTLTAQCTSGACKRSQAQSTAGIYSKDRKGRTKIEETVSTSTPTGLVARWPQSACFIFPHRNIRT